MNQLLLHESTNTAIKAFLAKPSHAVIIEGQPGAGKRTVADYIAAELLGISVEKLSNYPQLLLIEPKNTSISIAEIRQTQLFLKLKTTGQATIRRILIVDKAELMTIEAQNAFLKILEEPPTDTVIFILTNQKIKLLPTIRSRAQLLSVKSISKDQIDRHFNSKGKSQADIDKAFNIAGSRVGLISSILKIDRANQTLDSIDQAKQILAMSKFQRLAAVDRLSKDREYISSFIEALITISQAALRQTLTKDNVKQAKSWHRSLGLALDAERQLRANPNNKLLLTNLLINL